MMIEGDKIGQMIVILWQDYLKASDPQVVHYLEGQLVALKWAMGHYEGDWSYIGNQVREMKRRQAQAELAEQGEVI